MSMVDQSSEAFLLIPGQPLVHTIGIAWLVKSLLGDPMRGVPVGDFEQRRASFPHMRQGVMMDRFLQGDALRLIQPQGPTVFQLIDLDHGNLLSEDTSLSGSLPLPILIVKVH
jgi:hypothetical protein